MLLHKDELIGADEHAFICLVCETQFVHFGEEEPVCPKCGSRGEQTILSAAESEEEEDYRSEQST